MTKGEITRYFVWLCMRKNIPKWNFWEVRTELYFEWKGYNKLHVGQINSINQTFTQWIDHVFEKNGVYYIVESKFGTSTLKTLLSTNTEWKRIKQMDEDWVEDRLLVAVWKNQDLRDRIFDDYVWLVSEIDLNGQIILHKVDKAWKKENVIYYLK
jgi:putative ribosome biogenesis GTPase RsgA